MIRLFQDRMEAGRQLARELASYRSHPARLVLALPRGGVPVAYEVAIRLQAPLDLFIVRKLGVPGHEELAMGAIASGGTRVLNREVVEGLQIPESVIEAVTERERAELERRERLYRGERPPPEVKGRTVLLVDDGVATGSTMRAAIAALQQLAPDRLVVAVPTGARQTCEQLAGEVDEMLCLTMPDPFQAVGLWYEDFSQTTDEEVRELLQRASQTGQAKF